MTLIQRQPAILEGGKEGTLMSSTPGRYSTRGPIVSSCTRATSYSITFDFGYPEEKNAPDTPK